MKRISILSFLLLCPLRVDLSTFSLFSTHDALSQEDSVYEAWVERYDGPGNDDDYASALTIDGSGSVYVTGSSYSLGTFYDYATIKYDASGGEQWVARYNAGNNLDFASALAIDGSGNVYVTGRSYGFGAANRDYATIKYDASGVEQWVARYSGLGNGDDDALALEVDDSGSVYVTGNSSGLGTGPDYATIKYDASGVEQWIARYNGPGNGDDVAHALAVDDSGNVYVTGRSPGSGTFYDYATIKYDASGVEQWVARYNGPGNGDDDAFALEVDGSGNVYVTGNSNGLGTFDDYAIIKYDASGVEQWIARYNGPGNGYDVAHALAVDDSGNVYVTGYSSGSGTGYDYATIKYDVLGVEQWVARYNGPGNGDDDALALEVDGSGNVYVTGWSLGSGLTLDYATIKYEQAVTGVEKGEEHPTAYSLSQNYPNPFNPSTTIRYGLPAKVYVRLEVFNLLGERLALLVDANQEAGYHEVVFGRTDLASGVYLYRLVAGSFVSTKKFLFLR